VITVGPAASAGRVWVTEAISRSWSVSTVSSRAGFRPAWALSIVHCRSTRRSFDSTSTGRAYTSVR
jgi:hypothetical protein